MSKTITITYKAKPIEAQKNMDPICPVFERGKCAAETYAPGTVVYDNRNFGVVKTAEQFIQEQVAHPGLVAALKQAMAKAPQSYTYEEANSKEALYAMELAPALVDADGFGFIIVVA